MARFKTMVERGSIARIRAAADFVLSMCAGPDSGRPSLSSATATKGPLHPRSPGTNLLPEPDRHG
jgi:hypothetical protein